MYVTFTHFTQILGIELDLVVKFKMRQKIKTDLYCEAFSVDLPNDNTTPQSIMTVNHQNFTFHNRVEVPMNPDKWLLTFYFPTEDHIMMLLSGFPPQV